MGQILRYTARQLVSNHLTTDTEVVEANARKSRYQTLFRLVDQRPFREGASTTVLPIGRQGSINDTPSIKCSSDTKLDFSVFLFLCALPRFIVYYFSRCAWFFFLARQNTLIFDLYLNLVGSVFKVSRQRRGAVDRLAVREIINDSALRPVDKV
jgi:hypothetical protein